MAKNSIAIRPEELATKGHIDKLEASVEKTNNLMYAMVVVFFLALVAVIIAVDALFIDYYRSKEISYQELGYKIDRQGDKIDRIIEHIKSQATSHKGK